MANDKQFSNHVFDRANVRLTKKGFGCSVDKEDSPAHHLGCFGITLNHLLLLLLPTWTMHKQPLNNVILKMM